MSLDSSDLSGQHYACFNLILPPTGVENTKKVSVDSAPKNRFGLSVIFSFNLVQLKGIYQNFAISRAFNIAPRPLKILKDFLKDLGKKK